MFTIACDVSLHTPMVCFMEVENINFDLKKMLLYGGLPAVYSSKNPKEELKHYAGSYLREEIQASAFVRKIENYSNLNKTLPEKNMWIKKKMEL